MNLEVYILLFFIYSFIGWIIEVCYTYIVDHKLINRGFLIGPLCPIYGWGCILMTILLNKYTDNLLLLFFMSIVIATLLEYITSYLMEKLFNARWWDYSHNKFNINGRVCAETMIPFGIFGCVVTKIVNPFFINIIENSNSSFLIIICIILIIIYIIDNIISFNVIIGLKHTIISSAIDSTEEITKRVKNIIFGKSIFYRRLLHAFPNFKLRLPKIKIKL